MSELLRSSVLAGRSGAVFSDDTHLYPGLHLHSGDPVGEQWVLESGDAVTERLDLIVIEVSGEDRLTWLTSLASQTLLDMVSGDSRELLILDPQGHIEFQAGVIDNGEATWLVTSTNRAQAFCDWLMSMTFMLRVSVSVRTDLALFGQVFPVGQIEDSVVATLPGYIASWIDPWPECVPGGTTYYQDSQRAHPGSKTRFVIRIVEGDQAGQFVRAWLDSSPNAKVAGNLAWEAVRVFAWRPSIDYDVDERTIPSELDWLRTAVHLEKGCYRGQESVARVVNLGRPPRRLVMLQLDGFRGDLPEAGATITVGSRTIGRVTSVARHGDFGPIALAVVSRMTPPDMVFDLDGIAAAQEIIVPVEGKSAASPQSRPGQELRNPQLRRPDIPAFGGGAVVGGI